MLPEIQSIGIAKSIIPDRREGFSEIPLENVDYSCNGIDHLSEPNLECIAKIARRGKIGLGAAESGF